LRDRRNDPPSRRSVYNRADTSQRNLIIAASLFVLALLVVGVLLLTGGDDDEQPGIGAATRTPTATATTTQGTPGATPTPASGQVSGNAPTPTLSSTVTPTVPSTPTAQEPEPSPTPTAVEVEPTETPTEAAEEPTATEEPEPASPDPTATFPPTVGEFGPLPPAQVVSGGSSRPLDLDFELGIDLGSVPGSGSVYLIDWGTWSADLATTVASRQGIGVPATSSGSGFQAVDGAGEIYFSRGVVQYVNRRAPVGGTLEENATVIENARIWLNASGIVGTGIGEGTIVGRDDVTMRAVVLFKPAEPTPLLAFYPSATVTISPGGDVREANIRWPDGYSSAAYDMRPANQIWNDVLAGEGSIEADLSELPGSGAVVGTFTAYNASIAYSLATGSSGDYLVPLIVFSGEIVAADSGAAVPAWVYIQGVYGQLAPRG
jgi:hypothetical protein